MVFNLPSTCDCRIALKDDEFDFIARNLPLPSTCDCRIALKDDEFDFIARNLP